jgi:hypothetical protein
VAPWAWLGCEMARLFLPSFGSYALDTCTLLREILFQLKCPTNVRLLLLTLCALWVSFGGNEELGEAR